MRLRVLLCAWVWLGAAAAARAQVPHWWLWAPKGKHVPEGPGAAAPPGALVVSPVETAMAGALSGLVETVSTLTEGFDKLSSKQDEERKRLKEAVGNPVSGEDMGAIVPSVDPVSLVRRRQMLEELKASADAPRYAHFIAYFEAMQAHEARQLIFIKRANVLIQTNQRPLNWQERVRLAAEVGLLDTHQTIAQQEATEAYNRALLQAEFDRLRDAQDELDRRQQEANVQTMLMGTR